MKFINRFTGSIGWVICIAFILRALLLFIAFQNPERSILPDTDSYIQPALALLENGGQYTTASAIRTPIYPMFIALVYWLFGKHLAAIISVQILVSTLTVLLTYRLGLQFFPKNVAVLGAFLAAISVELIVHSFYIITETLFTFLLLASLLALTIYLKKEGISWLIISALLLAFTILCRPIVVFFPIFYLLLILLFSKKSMRSRAREGIIYIVCTIAVLLPWVWRNNYFVGLPTISTISNLNLLYYNAVSLEANLRELSEAQVRTEMDSRVAETLLELGWQDNEANRASAHSLLARKIILAHPFRYALLHLKSDVNNLLPSITEITEILGITAGGKGTASVLNQYGILAAARHYFGDHLWIIWLLLPIILLLGLIYLGSLGGVWWLISKHHWQTLIILLVPVMYLLLIPGAPSLPRFRVPVMPYLTLLAGYGLGYAFPYFLTKFIAWKKSSLPPRP